jgi:hypothetical protein
MSRFGLSRPTLETSETISLSVLSRFSKKYLASITTYSMTSQIKVCKMCYELMPQKLGLKILTQVKKVHKFKSGKY